MKEYDPHPSSWYVFILTGFIGVAALILYFGWPYLAETWGQSADARTRIVAAFISVSGTLVSAIAGVLLYTMQQTGRENEHLKREAQKKEKADADEYLRLGRLAAALRAEITESLTRLDQQFTREQIVNSLKTDRANFDEILKPKGAASAVLRGTPAGIALESNVIFEQHQNELKDLPETVLWAIISYYQNDAYLARYLNGITTGAFDNVSLNRQRKATVMFRDLGQDTLRAGLRAKAVLDAFLIQHDWNERSTPEKEKIVKLSKELMTRRPTDEELATILENRDTREHYGNVLRSLPSDESSDHIQEFFDIIGVES